MDDTTDRQLEGWSGVRPDLEVDALQVTARLTRVGALSALRVAGPPYRLSPTHLAKGLMLSSAGITSRIDRLERRGFVRRLADPNDRRGVMVELTDEGLGAVDSAVAALTVSDRQLLARLEPDEIAQLESILRKLLGGLELPE